MSATTLYWIAFIAIFIIVYGIDLYVTSHREKTVSVKSSLTWTAVWISIALCFGFSLYFFFPQNPGSTIHTGPIMMSKFISGYLTEYSLSVDNLFVFIMIFSMMGIHPKNQPSTKTVEVGYFDFRHTADSFYPHGDGIGGTLPLDYLCLRVHLNLDGIQDGFFERR